MALEANRNQVAVFIGASMCLWFDVVNSGCWYGPAVPQAFLTDVPVTLEDACAYNIPLAAVAALMSALSALVLLPSFVKVIRAIT